MLTAADSARLVMHHLAALGRITDEPGRLTRLACSPAMRRANDLVAGWMRQAGMTAREDAAGNLIGHYPATAADAKTFLLGSHLDTVSDAGKFDGPLGVLVALACVQKLRSEKRRLPFALDVIAFADEEGVRFHTSYLGSRAMTGAVVPTEFQRVDASGVTLAEALRKFGGNPKAIASCRRRRKQLLGYAEVHIEQGPVLEAKRLPVGVVTAIAGQSRIEVAFHGQAAHAGTTPMRRRRDALCAAAEFILAVNATARRVPGLVATVGQIAAHPGACNVIPGRVVLSLDARHQQDSTRTQACGQIRRAASLIARSHGCTAQWTPVQSTPAVPCAANLSTMLAAGIRRAGHKVLRLPSGAGHDAAVMAAVTPVTMLFVRCRGGVSHHPDESVAEDDVRVAVTVLNDFLHLLAEQHERV